MNKLIHHVLDLIIYNCQDYFYEYIMVLRKIKNVKDIKIKISDKYSKNYYRKVK